MKKTLIGCTVLAVMTGSAIAADLPSRGAPIPVAPPPPVFTWTGFYAGLNLGGISATKAGIIGGGQLGYNWQWTDRFLSGVEADFNARSRLSSNNSFGGLSGGSGAGFLGTARGRIGFLAAPSFLIYATGGLAYGTSWASRGQPPFLGAIDPTTLGTPPLVASSNQNAFRVGYTAGAGLEYKFAPNWSVKAEYLFVDLGRRTSDGFGLLDGSSSRSTAHIARLGVNYHFSLGSAAAPVVARY